MRHAPTCLKPGGCVQRDLIQQGQQHLLVYVHKKLRQLDLSVNVSLQLYLAAIAEAGLPPY